MFLIVFYRGSADPYPPPIWSIYHVGSSVSHDNVYAWITVTWPAVAPFFVCGCVVEA